MKKIILSIAVSVLFFVSSQAQQLSLVSQLYFMRMLYNPALTAYNGSTNLFGFYREQWTGLPGHPVTGGAVGDISLWKDRIGTGFHVYSDNTSIIHNVNAQFYYAQKIHLAKDHLLSLGVSAGVMETHIDYSNAVIADPGDPNVFLNGKSGPSFDMNIGLAYQWKKLTLGFSVPQLLNTHATFATYTQNARFDNYRHYIISGSYEISINHEKFNIEPNVLVKKGSSQPWQVDAGVMANYKRIVYLGAAYRLQYGVSMMAALRINEMVTIGYAYEYPILKDVQYSDTKGTHEVILGISFTKLMHKKSNDNEDEFRKKFARQDSINTVVRHDLDSALQNIDSLNKSQVEQDKKIQDLNDRLKQVKDSLDKLTEDYRKHIAEKGTTNFGEGMKGEKGDIYRLNNVNFDLNSSKLRDESYVELDKVVYFLNQNPAKHIRINGHTDYIASDEYNQLLSDRRAKAVYDYLISKGIASNRMVYIGFGKRVPIADNTTEEGRALNRRVEVEITN